MRLDQKYKTLFSKNGLTTNLRICHFLAQIEHESAGFKHLKEIGNDAYFKKYEGRKDLGNTQPGDGLKFKGRGYIQITGRSNYTELSKDLGIDFVNNPQLLEQEVNAILSALWYWNKRGLNKFADANDIKAITKRINGGFNGLADREAKFKKWSSIIK